MSGRPFRMLVICTGNRARSQMAQGWLRHLGGTRVEVDSAGIEPKGVHPLAIRVMAEVGIDISGGPCGQLRRRAIRPGRDGARLGAGKLPDISGRATGPSPRIRGSGLSADERVSTRGCISPRAGRDRRVLPYARGEKARLSYLCVEMIERGNG